MGSCHMPYVCTILYTGTYVQYNQQYSWSHVMDYHGLSWTILDYHGLSGLSWTFIDYHRLSLETWEDYDQDLDLTIDRQKDNCNLSGFSRLERKWRKKLPAQSVCLENSWTRDDRVNDSQDMFDGEPAGWLVPGDLVPGQLPCVQLYGPHAHHSPTPGIFSFSHFHLAYKDLLGSQNKNS